MYLFHPNQGDSNLLPMTRTLQYILTTKHVAREYSSKELGHLESDTFWVEKYLGATNELGSASQETQSLTILLLLFA